MGDGVGYVAESTFSTLPEEARDSLVNIYGVYKREFPTDNQSCAVNFAAWAALWKLTAGGGIKIPGKGNPLPTPGAVLKLENNVGKNLPGNIGSSHKASEWHGGKLSESEFLRSAPEYLGKNYRSLPNGRYISEDGLRQVRYGKHEVSSKKHHAHFESHDPTWRKSYRKYNG